MMNAKMERDREGRELYLKERRAQKSPFPEPVRQMKEPPKSKGIGIVRGEEKSLKISKNSPSEPRIQRRPSTT